MKIDIIKDNNQYDEQIAQVILKAFKQDNEVKLVKAVKENSDYYISYIALVNDIVVGHVLISPMLLNGQKTILSLAPISVLDEYQNTGIGTQLIRKALSEACRNDDYKLVTVLGSEHYYQRFGFKPYNIKKFNLPFEIENRYFHILEIEENVLNELEGNFDYPTYFNI
ncbi:MAG: N-acetyltransferase [Bacilli bacterium]|jgi:predicted N-acetyltransferase YhbS|nr:N-acetyltransferase [Bacilli bacterium]